MELGGPRCNRSFVFVFLFVPSTQIPEMANPQGNTTTTTTGQGNDNASILSLPTRAASDFGRGYLVSFARSSVLSLFTRLSVGLLTIKDVDGGVMYFGDKTLRPAKSDDEEDSASASSSSSPLPPAASLTSPLPVHATLVVKNDAFWLRMFFGADLGFSEAYMADEVATPDLGKCFDVRRRDVSGDLFADLL